jgi:hypothetical protein
VRYRIFQTSRLAAGVALACLAAAPAAEADTSSGMGSTCSVSQLSTSEPFAAYGDSNEYFMLPGESPDSFSGDGWTLTGGAQLLTTTLADGATGTVLDLPSGAQAVSPRICLRSGDVVARAMVLGGGAVSVSASYDEANPLTVGLIAGSNQWAPSGPLTLPASGQPNAEAQFTLTGAGPGDVQLYDLAVDPRMTGS